MGNVSIVFCFNDRYCILAAGAIASLIKNTTSKYQYDLYILHDDISEKNRYLINSLNDKENIKISFLTVDPKTYFSGELFTRPRFSKNAYSRLFLHKVLPFLDKVLYLDADLIINFDVAELYNTDITNYSVAAVPEYTVAKVETEKLKSTKVFRDAPAEIRKYENYYNYFTQYMGYSQQEIDTYFNSGVLLINLKRAGKILEGAPKLLNRRYLTHDQCILNILFKDDKLILEHKYNVWSNHVSKFINEHGKLPDIIHYYTAIKPHQSMSKPFESEYWKAISPSAVYYPAIEGFVDNKINSNINNKLEKQLGTVQAMFNNDQQLENLYYNLRRTHKRLRKRRVIRQISRFLVDSKRYKKLKQNPGLFFADSKSSLIRFLGKFYK